MDYSGIGKQFEGLAKLAMIGAGLIIVAEVLGLIVLGRLVFWLWNHVSIH